MSESQGERYQAVLSHLYGSRRGGIDLGLDRMRDCLSQLGLQDGGARYCVQVAGTNGKGSTATYIASILQQAGIRVGVFSSPHLLTLRERFCIDQEMISQADLIAAYTAVCVAAEELTFFERVTAMAAWLFAQREVEVAVYEVGLGGRLDSTTAIPNTIGVVTGIGLDHGEYLGTTLESVAFEKAGIFAAGAHAILGLSAPQNIRDLLEGQALRVGASVTRVSSVHQAMVPRRLELAGQHQRDNAAAAAAAAMTLRSCHELKIDDADILRGLEQAKISGRFEEIEPGLWIDGAHNEQAATALAQLMVKQSPWVLVVGLCEGKDVEGFLSALGPYCKAVICTEAQNERACQASTLAQACRNVEGADMWVEVLPDLEEAMLRASEVAEDGPMLVTGSLLLLGELLVRRGHASADPFVVSDPAPKAAR